MVNSSELLKRVRALTLPFQLVAQQHVVAVACLVAAVEVPGLASQVLRKSLLVK